MDDQLRKIGNFHLNRKVHGGTEADVYEARFAQMGGVVQSAAIKVLKPHLACIGDQLRAFLHEVAWARDLRHAIFPRVVEAGEHSGNYFLAMEFIDGWTLSEVLRAVAALQAPLPCELGLAIVHELAEGVQSMHEFRQDEQFLGVVHLGIDPDNIMVRKSGSAVLLDFGMTVASAAGEVAQPDGGSETYHSPEALRMLPLDGRADVYSLGCVLASLAQCMPRHMMGEDLPALIARACHLHAEERFASMRDFREAIEIVAQNRGLELSTRACAQLTTEIFGHSAGHADPRSRRPQSVVPMRMHSEGLETAFAPPMEAESSRPRPDTRRETEPVHELEEYELDDMPTPSPGQRAAELQHTMSPRARILSAATVAGASVSASSSSPNAGFEVYEPTETTARPQGGLPVIAPTATVVPRGTAVPKATVIPGAEAASKAAPKAAPKNRFVAEHEAVTVAAPADVLASLAQADEATAVRKGNPGEDGEKSKRWPEELIPTVNYQTSPEDDSE